MKHHINILVYATLITLTCLFLSDSPWFIWIIVALTIVFSIVLTLGVLFLKFNYFLPSLIRLKNKEVLLTFDDGPHPENTPKILDILQEENVKAIFFVIGKKAEQHPEIIARIISEGHLIGDHTYTHNNMMALFPTEKLIKELTQSQVTLTKLTGKKIPIFRAPIGYTNPNFARALKEMKLQSIGWSLRSYDTLNKEENKLRERLLSKTKASDIVLLHDNLDITTTVLKDYIQEAKTNGILFASTMDIHKLQHG
ncbi:MAG TPA: polysaccharide deacetylase family protein [Crocinitomicaceae bacterium]|nr:polysaccharide deacetylase family protein [Crocinitomicaceae bacterium]